MRVLPILISLVCVAIPIHASAKPKPKIAVAPLQGDAGNKVAQAVVDALAGKDFAVVGPKEVGREMKKLGLSDELDTRDARKLTAKLGVVAVIDGKVGKAGKKRSLHLEIHRRGKSSAGFTIEFKSMTSDGFRRGVHDEVAKRLDGASDDESEDDEDQARSLAAKQAADDERKRKQADDEVAAARAKKEADDDERKRKRSDDDPPRTKRQAADDDERKRGDDEPAAARRKRVAEDDDEPAVRKRKGRKLADDEAAPQVLARVAAGGIVAQRRLTYATRSGLTPMQAPPRVITTAGAGRVDGEIYPFALSNPRSGLAGLGLAGAYDKTFGLSIKLPNQALRAPIDQAHYAVGARYRFGVGAASAVVLGVDYVRRHYIADRSTLMAAILDAPDVDYAAVTPGIAVRTPVTPAVTLFGGLDGMLVLDAGPIQKSASYGAATVYGVDVVGGLDIALAKLVALRIALEYSQINFSFGTKGVMANNRDNDVTTQDVMGATDRSIGAAVTLGLAY